MRKDKRAPPGGSRRCAALQWSASCTSSSPRRPSRRRGWGDRRAPAPAAARWCTWRRRGRASRSSPPAWPCRPAPEGRASARPPKYLMFHSATKPQNKTSTKNSCSFVSFFLPRRNLRKLSSWTIAAIAFSVSKLRNTFIKCWSLKHFHFPSFYYENSF